MHSKLRIPVFLTCLFSFGIMGFLSAQSIEEQLETLESANTKLEFLALDGQGGWALVYDDFGYAYHYLSKELGQALSKANSQRLPIRSLSFTPSGGWVLVWGKNRFAHKNVPTELVEKLKKLREGGHDVHQVTFYGDDGWLILFDENEYEYFNLPQACGEKLAELNKNDESIKWVAFSSRGGWAVLTGFNGFWYAGIPTRAVAALQKMHAADKELRSLTFTPGGGFVLVHSYSEYEANLPGEPIVQQSNGEHQSAETSLNREDLQKVSSVEMYAVVVGVADYNHIQTLSFTDDDAYRMALFLKSPEGGALDDDHLTLLVDQEATRKNIINALDKTFSRADDDDVVLFYFSGHGLQGTFLPVDYDGKRNFLWHRDVRSALAKSNARHKICIADACHSGSMGGGKRALTDQEVVDTYYSAWEQSKGGTALMLSSSASEISVENSGIRQGVFTYNIIRGLKGFADEDHNRIVTVKELYNYARKEVRKYTRNRQNPVLSGNFDDNMPIGIVR